LIVLLASGRMDLRGIGRVDSFVNHADCVRLRHTGWRVINTRTWWEPTAWQLCSRPTYCVRPSPRYNVGGQRWRTNAI